MQEPIVAF